MIRKSFLPVLLALAACDITQELQGDGQTPDGAAPPASADAGVPSTADGGTTQPTTDGGNLDGATNRQISTCVPASAIGKTSVEIKGNESVYMDNVADLAVGAGRVWALSKPWSFSGAPLSGPGPVISYDVSATLQSFTAMAMVPFDTNPGGLLTTTDIGAYNLPTKDGQILALRGSAGGLVMPGRVFEDQGDVFYFKLKAPSQLVHSVTKSNPNEQVLVEYPTASDTSVTAATVVGSYVYFATAPTASPSLADAAMFHRVPRTGGTVEALGTLTSFGPVTDIHQDGNSLYLTPGAEDGSHGTQIGVYSIPNGTMKTGSLTGLGGTDAFARRTNVVFDGTAFYYGSDPGAGGGCSGKLLRVSKAVAVDRTGGSAEVIASNLDFPKRILATGGAVYVGTQGVFAGPNAYPGQLLRWTP